MTTKIATVTLNPAIDQTVRVDGLQLNQVNRAQAMQFDAGGKGVNVASFLADYGHQVAVTGFLGDENPHLFELLFAVKHIEDRFVRVFGRTRTNVKIVDEARQETTDINMMGITPTAMALTELLTEIDSLALSCDWFALSGNLPAGVPPTIYATLIERIKAHGKQVVLDTSREALQAGIQAGPTIVKPNILELEQILGRKLVGCGAARPTAVLQAAQQLLQMGIQLVVISMGEQGALFVTADEVVTAVPPHVPVKSTVGAGDAMVAGLIAGSLQSLPLPHLARLATAFSVNAVTRVGAHLPNPHILQTYVSQVSIRTLESTT